MQTLTVLVTRPSPHGEALCELVEGVGHHAIFIPTIEFEGPPDALAFDQAIELLGEQDWLVFISPHAVYAAIPTLRRRWPHLPATVKFAAVGAGTASALKNAGYPTTVWPLSEWNSEGLLDMPTFQSVEGVKIAVVRGKGGREYIDKTLAERGAHVTPVIAYQRVMPSVDRASLLTELKSQSIDVVVCTSGEAISNLKTMVGDADWSLIKDASVIVMSNRVKLLAQDLNFQRVFVTANASNDAILQTIARIKELV